MQTLNKNILRSTISIIKKKWITNILRDMSSTGFYPRRFKEFMDLNPGLSAKVLSNRLQELEKNGFINKIITPTKPKYNLYFMTEISRDLVYILTSLSTFGIKWNKNSKTKDSSNLNSSIDPINLILKDATSNTLKSISNAWTLELLLDLRKFNTSSINFTNFLKFNEGLSRKMLAQRLRDLEIKGFIIRNIEYGTSDPVYALMEKGRDIDKILYEITFFGLKWYSEKFYQGKLSKDELRYIIEEEFEINPIEIHFKSKPSVGKISTQKK